MILAILSHGDFSYRHHCSLFVVVIVVCFCVLLLLFFVCFVCVCWVWVFLGGFNFFVMIYFNFVLFLVLFNDAHSTFYLRLYGVRHMVKDHSDS